MTWGGASHVTVGLKRNPAEVYSQRKASRSATTTSTTAASCSSSNIACAARRSAKPSENLSAYDCYLRTDPSAPRAQTTMPCSLEPGPAVLQKQLGAFLQISLNLADANAARAGIPQAPLDPELREEVRFPALPGGSSTSARKLLSQAKRKPRPKPGRLKEIRLTAASPLNIGQRLLTRQAS